MKICFYKLVRIGLLFYLSQSLALARDLGFRFVNGKCIDQEGKEGLNPYFFGQCANLRRVRLNADFRNVDFSGSDFSGSFLSHSNFKDSILAKVNFDEANLVAVDFSRTKIQGSTFVNARFDVARFYPSEIEDSDFRGVSFVGANFFVKALRSNFEGTKFHEARWGGLFKETNFDGADFRQSTLSTTKFENSTLRNANFKGAYTTSFLSFTNSDLRHSNFLKFHSDHKIDFLESSLVGSIFTGASIKEVNFSGSDLSQADFRLIEFNQFNTSFESTILKDVIYGLRSVFSLPEEERSSRGMLKLEADDSIGVVYNERRPTFGWRICHKSLFSEKALISEIVKNCEGDRVVVACGRRHRSEYVSFIAASGSYQSIFKQGKIVNNNVGFFFNSTEGIGFSLVDRFDNPYELKVKMRVEDGFLTSGGICGDWVRYPSEVERIFYTTNYLR